MTISNAEIPLQDVVGWLHSTESFGAVDGPGVRFVAFLQGCPLRCLFCHNPDTWDANGGKIVTASELVKDICSYKSFIKKGGVTLSGGEPLLQADFCEAVTILCHEQGFHVALDTAGCVPLAVSHQAISAADLLLLDIKDIDSADCLTLSGQSNANALATLNFCEEIRKPVWLRHVLLPEYTLYAEKLHRLGEYIARYSCIEKVELLPFHTMGLFKWESMGLTSKLIGIEPPTEREIAAAKATLIAAGVNEKLL